VLTIGRTTVYVFGITLIIRIFGPKRGLVAGGRKIFT
jgi:hypothetical protein